MNTIPDYLLAGLNEPQRDAVRFKEGPLLVLAGPGSGKTRVVTHRIAALLHQGVGPSQIAALTFTNKAADEMKNRLAVLAPDRYVWIGTFHKFCAYLLRRYINMVGLQPNFTIYDTDESLALLKTIVENRKSEYALPPGITPQKIASSISWAKNNLVLPDAYRAGEGSLIGKVVEDIYPQYQDELRRANAVDFDDLLLHVAVLLQENPEVRKMLDNRFRYILVDEYQDTNTVQYVIAKALSIDHRNLAVTGDPDQSIYGWRGANIKNILDFEKDFPDTKVIRLERNYRSTPQILAAADALIENNVYRKKKRLVTENTAGQPVRLVRCLDQKEEAETIAKEIAEEVQSGKRKPNDYAIFYRMNALSRNLEHALRSRKIPFQLIRGLEFFHRKEIKDVIAYLRVIYNPSDTVSLARIVNEPARGIGKTTMKKLADRASQLGVSTMDIAREVSNFAGIAAKTKKSVTQFVKMIDLLSDAASREYPVESLITMVLQESGYRDQYADSESEEDQERLENIEELLTVAREFDTKDMKGTGGITPVSSLEEFLEQAALVSDIDDLDKDADRVSLMTLHAAKGLEFPVVYIVALEEGILPHERSQDDTMQLEEERRLFFVGITRAEEELRISRAERRDFRGSYTSAIFSRFLTELPNDSNVVKFDLAADIADAEDQGNGIRLVREQQPDYDGIDTEYTEYDEPTFSRRFPEPGEKPKQKFSMMTAADLLRRQKAE
ncbi:DNA helicase [Planctomycetales bacterium]|nr:DNA helicase [Planctomycetales bacterium]